MPTCSRPHPFRRLLLIAALVGAALTAPVAARAALDFVEVHKSNEHLAGVLAVVVSPDGANVYTAAPENDAVAVFRRDPATGALSLLQVEKDGVDGVDGLDFAYALSLSPDGAQLYVTGARDNAVAVFNRDANTGTLTFVEAQKNGVAGVEGLDGASAVAVSPDGSHVYAAGQLADAIVVFRRNATTGWLTFVEVQRESVGKVDGIAGTLGLMFSPDGSNLYVASGDDTAVTTFRRDATTGRLTLVAVEKEGPAEFGLSGIHSVAVSPDGAYVYSAANGDDAVGIFRRNKRTGALTFSDVVAQGIDGVDGLWGALRLTLSPDGGQVYVASTHSNGVAVFDRDARTGGLTYVETKRGGPDNDCLCFARAVAVSPDGKNVYVAGASSNALAVFHVAGK